MRGVPVPTVLRELGKLYDPPRTFLDHRNAFELLVATILSAQCTDARVNIITKTLFAKYRSPRDLLAVPPEGLQQDIRSCGHYRNKTRHLQGAAKLLLEKYDGEVPGTMDELLELPGVGRKTATVILYSIFGQEAGIAVDTHVWRVAKRLGLTGRNDQKRIELDLMKATPRPKWGRLHTLLVMHGRAICTARARQCAACSFAKTCPSSSVMNRADRAGVGHKQVRKKPAR